MDNIDINIVEEIDDVTVEITEGLSRVYVDGVTITGDGTQSDPLVAVGSLPVLIVGFTGDNTATYIIPELIGATILLLFTDNTIRVPTDYSLDNTTGTVTFISTLDIGTIGQILYK